MTPRWEKVNPKVVFNRLFADDADESMNTRVFNMIMSAYGGDYPDFKSSGDLPGGHDVWLFGHLDDDGLPEMVLFGKTKPRGIKWTGMACQNNIAAKFHLIRQFKALANTPGNFAEISGPLLKLMGQIPIIDNGNLVHELLEGKEFFWHGNGVYQRSINGQEKMKVMVGTV